MGATMNRILDYYGIQDEIMAKMDQLSNWDKWSQEERIF